jgi:hypothetical protein
VVSVIGTILLLSVWSLIMAGYVEIKWTKWTYATKYEICEHKRYSYFLGLNTGSTHSSGYAA